MTYKRKFAFTKSKETGKIDPLNRIMDIGRVNFSYSGNYILYASGDLHLSSFKNSEFFIAARAKVNVKGRTGRVNVQGLIKIVIPSLDQNAEDIFFPWLNKNFQNKEILEDREGKWLKKWTEAISTFDNPENRIIKKIKVDWKFIEKKEKITSAQIKILKAIYKVGWSKYNGNFLPVNLIADKKNALNTKVLKNAVSKNPLPFLIPCYHFIYKNGSLLTSNETIRELITIT